MNPETYRKPAAGPLFRRLATGAVALLATCGSALAQGVPSGAPEILNLPAHAVKLQLNAGDTSWMLISTALVLLMTIPGLALFYAGMVRKKNIPGDGGPKLCDHGDRDRALGDHRLLARLHEWRDQPALHWRS